MIGIAEAFVAATSGGRGAEGGMSEKSGARAATTVDRGTRRGRKRAFEGAGHALPSKKRLEVPRGFTNGRCSGTYSGNTEYIGAANLTCHNPHQEGSANQFGDNEVSPLK